MTCKFIIVEGIDKCGKSTFITKLMKALPNTILIKGGTITKPIDNSIVEKNKVLSFYENIFSISQLPYFDDKTIITDRFYPSQIVYSWKRKHDDFEDDWFINFENKLLDAFKDKIYFIYCITDPIVIARRFIADKEEHLEVDDIKDIISRYNKFYGRTKLSKTKIITSEESSVDSLISDLKGGLIV